MLDNKTAEKLHEMKLGAMAAALKKQLADQKMAQLSFEERFGLLVDAEWVSRKNNRLARLIKKADFAWPGACLEDIEYHADRELDKALIARLSTCGYIDEFHNIILLGATGSGKSWLACAFGNAACRMYYNVRYIRLPELFAELAVARAEGTYRKAIAQYKKVKLLILDEWLLYPLKDTEARDLLEITESRCKRASTIFCSQFDVGGWHEKIGEPTLADAVCDRIVHDSYTIVVKGDSMRKHKGLTEKA
jgi:DNA replication protein DnaC